MRKHLVRAMLLGLSVAVGTGAYGPAEAASHQKAKKHPATVAAKTPAKATKTAKTEKGEKSRKLARSAKTGAKLALAGSAAVVTHHAIRHASAAPDDLGAARRLAVQSSAAMVLDQSSGEVIYQKNASSIMPIASISKLMTAMVVLDSKPDMSAPITIAASDVDTLRNSRSRLPVGTVLTREHAMLLALMSSENRAAHALARSYPGGLRAFVDAMNRKARSLGMNETHFEDPTGLTSNNVSTAADLAKMVAAAHNYSQIRDFTTTSGATVEIHGRVEEFHNTNALIRNHNSAWDIGLSKTGYIQEAGKCLVMQARVAEKPVVIVLLDSAGAMTRIGDAQRIKHWMESASLGRRSSPV